MTDPTTTDAFRESALRQDAARRAADDAARRDSAADAAEVQREERSRLATHKDPTLTDKHDQADTERAGVQWVRPTDLAARAGGRVVEQGLEWNTLLRDAALEGVREGRAQLHERLARRQQDLEPESMPERAQQRSFGRTGVSR